MERTPLLSRNRSVSWRRRSWLPLVLLISTILVLLTIGVFAGAPQMARMFGSLRVRNSGDEGDVIQAAHGVVAADDARCSDIGTAVLREGGHAVDAAVATALCLGVVSLMSSGIGGGSFLVVRSSADGEALAYDMRETAPGAAYKDMYNMQPEKKVVGALSMGVPGELAGLHEAWKRYGRLPWKRLVLPSIELARHGFLVSPYLAATMKRKETLIMADPGLRRMLAPAGILLKPGDKCYNRELADTLQAISEYGPKAFYNGSVGENLVKDVQDAGGILTMQDLQNYKVKVRTPIAVDVMGYQILGMPPPSSGTLGLSLVLNILAGYGTEDAANGPLGVHHLIEALKHMLAIRMNLGDPDFVNITSCQHDMLSPEFAAQLRKKILDNTTFAPNYYMPKWSQLQDHGTSHFCIVDAERNAVSMTSTVNYPFGASVLSPSTGIVLNNEMDDFSMPVDAGEGGLPAAPSNFIQPNKRPLSSMTPIIVLKDNQLAGVIGGSGGTLIIPAVIQVFVNHFILSMGAEASVQKPRVYHKLIPNTVLYENWTFINGEHIELPDDTKLFLKQRGHELKAQAGGAICQLVVHSLRNPVKRNRSRKENPLLKQVFLGILTAVSDPRKDGAPAGF
ncbi:Gamma-glutamyltranspeptidase 3 [Nymphaea thermarum]|nr:Gamma-glutamyltranspeptidase 3 [Nymphaea thermarum]